MHGTNTTVRTHTWNLPHLSVAIQTCLSFLTFPPYQGHTTWLYWMNRAASRCNNSHDLWLVMYGCESRTNITVVSRKTWGAACTNSGYQVLHSDFSSALEQGCLTWWKQGYICAAVQRCSYVNTKRHTHTYTHLTYTYTHLRKHIPHTGADLGMLKGRGT